MADHAAATNSGLILTDSQYDTLRRFVELVFPGLGAFYATVAVIWGLGYATEVVGTATALSVLGGVLLKFARKGYEPPTDIPRGGYDGSVVSDHIDGQPVIRVQLTDAATENLLNKSQLVIKGFDASS